MILNNDFKMKILNNDFKMKILNNDFNIMKVLVALLIFIIMCFFYEIF
jgi:hypothetical protein